MQYLAYKSLLSARVGQESHPSPGCLSDLEVLYFLLDPHYLRQTHFKKYTRLNVKYK